MKRSLTEGPMNARIVIADGDLELSQLMMWLLRKRGYQTIEVHEGVSAMMLIRCMQPDLLVIALDLPGMNGIALSRVLDENAQTALLPTIMLIPKQNEPEIRPWLTAGFHDYIIKPFAPHDLVTKVERMLAFVHARPV